jgi:hypothetical protein
LGDLNIEAKTFSAAKLQGTFKLHFIANVTVRVKKNIGGGACRVERRKRSSADNTPATS